MKVALLQRANACDQISQRPGEGVRNKEHQRAAAQHRGQSQGQQQTVQTVEKRRRLIVGLEHVQPYRRIPAAREFEGCDKEAFLSQLNFLRSGLSGADEERAAGPVPTPASGFSVVFTTASP